MVLNKSSLEDAVKLEMIRFALEAGEAVHHKSKIPGKLGGAGTLAAHEQAFPVE